MNFFHSFSPDVVHNSAKVNDEMDILRVWVQIVGLGADSKTTCWELYWKFWMMSDQELQLVGLILPHNLQWFRMNPNHIIKGCHIIPSNTILPNSIQSYPIL